MIDLVMGAAVRYTPEQVRPFLASLRATGYKHNAVLFGDDTLKTLCAEFSAYLLPPGDLIHMPAHHFQVHASRFQWFERFLRKYPEHRGVLLVDVRDVIFQGSLDALPDQGLHAFEEDRRMSLGTCPYNSLWIRTVFGQSILDEVKNKPILCVGTVCGGVSNLIQYLSELNSDLMEAQPKTSLPQDQAVHNILCYYWRRDDVTIHLNEESPVYTVGYIPPDRLDCRDGIIRNAAGRFPAVIHQYDRFPVVKEQVLARVAAASN